MLYKTLNTITAIFSLVNGTFFLLAPSYSLSLMGTSTNDAGLLTTQFSGAIALGLAVICWRTRNTKSAEVQKVVATGNLTMFSLLVFVDILGLRSGLLNFTGWLYLTADLLLSLGYVVFLSRNRKQL